jgi:hypothetical protein
MNSPINPADDAAPIAPPPKRRRGWRIILGILAILLAVVVALPYLLCWTPLRNSMLQVAAHEVHGTLTTSDASFGWFSPPVVRGLEIRSRDDKPVVSVAAIELSQPLWKLLSHPQDLGLVRIENPQVNLVVHEDRTTNLTRTFPPPSEPRSKPRGLLDTAIEVVASNIGFSWQLAGSDHQWSVSGIGLNAALEPARMTASHRAELVLQPGKILDHYELSPAMCDDVLKFAAPILAHAPDVRGQVSLQLGGGRLPVELPRSGQLSGALTLHAIDVSPGPLARQLAQLFNSSGVVELARESNVEFRLADGRVSHQGLEFGIEQLRIRTSGSVGFDESIDMVAEVHFNLSEALTKKLTFLSKLNQQVLRIPIRGTLKLPQLDVKSLAANSPALLGDLFSKLKSGEAGGLEQTLQGLRDGGVLQPPADGEAREPDLPAAAGALLRGIIERRREKKQEKNANDK